MDLANADEDIDFTKPWSKSDVTFIVEQKKLYFNRAVLAFHSDVFDRMFNAEFRESDPQKDIELPEKKFEDVQAMFLVLKAPADHASPITQSNLYALLAMSDEYQMRQLAAECGKFILLNWRPHGTMHFQAVQLAFKYGMKSVAAAFLPLAACRRLSEIDAAADSLPSEVYAAILHGNAVRAHGVAPMRWAAEDGVPYATFKRCQACASDVFQSAQQCQCTANAPLNDPKIQAVLENFAKISQNMKSQ